MGPVGKMREATKSIKEGNLDFELPVETDDEDVYKRQEECQRQNAECDEILKKAAVYDASFQAQMLKAQNEENYSSAWF